MLQRCICQQSRLWNSLPIECFPLTYNQIPINCSFFLKRFPVCLKVSEYLFKQNRNMVKNKTVLWYTYFYNIFLNVLRSTFVSICNLPFLRSPDIGKIEVKVGPKTSYFSSCMSSCTNRIAVVNNFVSLICSQPKYKQKGARDFLFSNIFWIIYSWLFSCKTRFQSVELLQ